MTEETTVCKAYGIEIESVPGLLSYQECKEAITFHANNIAKSDDTSITINRARVDTLKRLLSLYMKYLNVANQE